MIKGKEKLNVWKALLTNQGPNQIPAAAVLAKSPNKGIWLTFFHWYLSAHLAIKLMRIELSKTIFMVSMYVTDETVTS